MKLSSLAPFALLMVMACAHVERGAGTEAFAGDLIHSDTPLLAGEGEDAWPQSFENGAGFGCVSRVAFGDWALREGDRENDPERTWYRVENYGAFHCFALVARAPEKADLENADSRPSFFVRLGAAQSHEGSAVEVWALQMGARPGSDYILLSRAPSEGTIKSFSVLQSKCPADRVRNGGALSILRTDYCAINSRADLVRLAQRMARLPPRGTLTLED